MPRVRQIPTEELTGKAREIAHPDWSCDGDRWPGMTALEPVRITEGFRATAAWYRDQGWL